MDTIEKSIYEGYIWYSNANTPECFTSKSIDQSILDKATNPYIIEAQLFDGKVSYSVKYVDGQYIVNKYTMSELSGKTYTEKVVKGNRMEDKNLCFNQYWEEKTDDLNCELKFLSPAEFVFTGFKK